MAERKVIYECRHGSWLYGTNTPESDEDFKGVFLPSTEDILGLGKCPEEWAFNVKLSDGDRNTAGDVDRKYDSLKRFINLCAQGQPGQIEMLFALPQSVTALTTEWLVVASHTQNFLSKKGIRPFLGFAIAQANKAVIKGENLNHIDRLIEGCVHIHDQNEPIKLGLFESFGKTYFCNVQVERFVNEHGFDQIRVAGRQFDTGTAVKTFKQALLKLKERYGTRSKAAAEKGYDYKSLMHAVRLLEQAEEYLLKGFVSMPRPNPEELLKIKRGEVDRDWFDYLNDWVLRIETEVLPKSTLPEEPDWEALKTMCIKMHRIHLGLK